MDIYDQFRRSENIEDRRRRPVAPEISTGTFGAGLPVPNVFEGNGGLLTGLGPNDFHTDITGRPHDEPMPFGQLARRLPQDPMPMPPPRMSTWTRSPNIEDRRETPLTPLEEARLIMRQIDPDRPHAAAASVPVPPISQLGMDAGMLDIAPGHNQWLAERIGALPSTMTAGR